METSSCCANANPRRTPRAPQRRPQPPRGDGRGRRGRGRGGVRRQRARRRSRTGGDLPVAAVRVRARLPGARRPAAPATSTSISPTSDRRSPSGSRAPTATTFVDTLMVTNGVALYGIANRPGRWDFRSGPLFPYGRREMALPVWAHRRGVLYDAVTMNDGMDSWMTFHEPVSSPESHFCRPMMKDGDRRRHHLRQRNLSRRQGAVRPDPAAIVLPAPRRHPRLEHGLRPDHQQRRQRVRLWRRAPVRPGQRPGRHRHRDAGLRSRLLRHLDHPRPAGRR